MKNRFAQSLLTIVACAAPLLVSSRAKAQDTPTATPDSIDTSDTSAPTVPAERTDDGDLGLDWLWFDANAGFSYTDLKSAQLAITPAGGAPVTIVDTSQSGLAYGFGGGIRLLFLTLGVRARNHTAMNLWQIDGEVGFRGRLGHVEPYFAGRFGYDTVGTLGQSVQVAGSSAPPPDVNVHGWNGGLALGVDYYFSHFVSIGGEASGDVIYLTRPAATPPALTPQQQAVIDADPQAKANYQKLRDAYQASASTVGFGAGLMAHVGIHF